MLPLTSKQLSLIKQAIAQQKTTVKLTSDGAEFKQGSQAFELLRESGVASGRRSLG